MGTAKPTDSLEAALASLCSVMFHNTEHRILLSSRGFAIRDVLSRADIENIHKNCRGQTFDQMCTSIDSIKILDLLDEEKLDRKPLKNGRRMSSRVMKGDGLPRGLGINKSRSGHRMHKNSTPATSLPRVAKDLSHEDLSVRRRSKTLLTLRGITTTTISIA
jgi:hypothetical protein